MVHTIEREMQNFNHMAYGDDNGRIAGVQTRSNLLAVPGTYD